MKKSINLNTYSVLIIMLVFLAQHSFTLDIDHKKNIDKQKIQGNIE